MKLDFAMLEDLEAAGATAKMIIAVLRHQYEKGNEARRRDVLRKSDRRIAGPITPELRLAVYERDQWECVYCGVDDHLTCDHVVAIKNGGLTVFENLVTACKTCNSRKQDKDRKAFERLLESEQKSTEVRRTSNGHASETSGIHAIGIPIKDAKFDLFWKAYPKRSGANPRAPAEKLFLGFVKAGVSADDIIAGAKAHAIAEPEKVGTQFIPQAVKWLRDRRWEDYLSSATSSETKEINWDQVLTSYKQFGHWSRFAGPGPDSPACKAPPEMLEKYELRTQ